MDSTVHKLRLLPLVTALLFLRISVTNAQETTPTPDAPEPPQGQLESGILIGADLLGGMPLPPVLPQDPFLRAVQQGETAVVESLLQTGTKSPIELDDALAVAVEHDRVDIVRLLLSKGASVNAVSKGGSPVFDLALRRGQISIIRVLLAYGADVNRMDPEFWHPTALHKAVEAGNFEIVKLLLDNGASIDVAESTLNYTPLTMAVEGNNLEMAKLLIERGADVNTKANMGPRSLLNRAGAKGNNAMVRLLMQAGAQDVLLQMPVPIPPPLPPPAVAPPQTDPMIQTAITQAATAILALNQSLDKNEKTLRKLRRSVSKGKWLLGTLGGMLVIGVLMLTWLNFRLWAELKTRTALRPGSDKPGATERGQG